MIFCIASFVAALDFARLLRASQRLRFLVGFFGLGDFPIAHVFPMGFGFKCLIIMLLVFLGFPFATCFFWAIGPEGSGSNVVLRAKCNAGRTYFKLGLGVLFDD